MDKDTVILLTEDDFGLAQLIKRNLERSGIDNQIIHFSDGQKVLDFLLRHRSGPHEKDHSSYFLLLDLKLPIVGGIQVMESLNKDDELKKIPVVVISSTDDQAEIKKCSKLGCICFLRKPFDYDEFVEEMEKLSQFLIDFEVPQT